MSVPRPAAERICASWVSRAHPSKFSHWFSGRHRRVDEPELFIHDRVTDREEVGALAGEQLGCRRGPDVADRPQQRVRLPGGPRGSDHLGVDRRERQVGRYLPQELMKLVAAVHQDLERGVAHDGDREHRDGDQVFSGELVGDLWSVTTTAEPLEVRPREPTRGARQEVRANDLSRLRDAIEREVRGEAWTRREHYAVPASAVAGSASAASAEVGVDGFAAGGLPTNCSYSSAVANAVIIRSISFGVYTNWPKAGEYRQ